MGSFLFYSPNLNHVIPAKAGIQKKSKTYSRRLLSLIKERTTALLTFPEMEKEVDIENTRVISLEHFSLFYEIVENRIIVISFWDNRRNPNELIKILLKGK